MKKAAFFIILTLFFCNCRQEKTLTIATGSVNGVYFPTGGVIGKFFEKYANLPYTIIVIPTKGSAENINGVNQGAYDFGICQSDRQYQAVSGLAEWQDTGPLNNLRAICAIYSEPVTLVADASQNINSIKDLSGKTVAIGEEGSGQIMNSREIFEAFELNEDTLAIRTLSPEEALRLFSEGKIDAFFYTIGHPNPHIRSAGMRKTPVRIIPITGTPADTLIKTYPYYSYTIIPGEYYPAFIHSQFVRTVGVKATLVTRADMKEEIVYQLIKAIMTHHKEFVMTHPAYRTITPQSMFEGLTAPLHSGVIRFLDETNLYNSHSIEGGAK